MKKILLTLVIALMAISAYTQSVRLNGYAGYAFDDSFDTYYSDNDYAEGKIRGGFQWGAGLEVLPREDMGVELLYYRQDTEAPITYWRPGDLNYTSRTVQLGVNYIMIAGNRYLKPGEKVEPFGGFMLGMAVFSNKNPLPGGETGATKFAWGVRLGTNIWASEKVGIKIQAQLLSAVQGMGGGLYFGTGGSGAGVTTYSSLLQFGLGGGLVFKLK